MYMYKLCQNIYIKKDIYFCKSYILVSSLIMWERETVRFVTLYAIQTLFLSKTAVKYLKFKVRYLAVTLRRLFIS